MKKYKHRKTGAIAVRDGASYYHIEAGQSYDFRVPNEFVEDSADWQPYPEVLLVTEDGVEITDKLHNLYWLLLAGFETSEGPAYSYNPNVDYAFKVFSTAAARDEYILENKPVLSVKEVLTWWSDKLYHFPGQREEALKQLAKTKL
jgi:hypothetical protein